MAILIQNHWPFLSFRNRAVADQYHAKVGQPVWSDMTIHKAVKEGYKKNGWVYKSIRMIGSAASSVPWMVYGADGEPIPEHPITLLMQKPNPRISKQTLMELLCAWLNLSGNAYLIPIMVNGRTVELWPTSPDRLQPIPTSDPVAWVKGYSLDQAAGVTYEPQEVIHFLFPDPANPIIGIGPLQAASKAVDVDNEHQDWQKSAIQNKGVLDGVFSFKREFKRIEDLEDITDKLNEKFTGKSGKRIGAVGSEATYTRIAATPQEMEFIESRKFNREEIFIIFGIPSQLAGVQESSTYNNYQTSELIFWLNTVVGLLDDLKDTLNFALQAELTDGVYLGYDLSNIPAVRRAKMDSIKSAKMMADMGVPVERINSIFDLKIEEYEGWGLSNPKTVTPKEPSDKEEERGVQLKRLDLRSSPEQQAEAREKEAINQAEAYEILLASQRQLVFEAIENGADIQGAVERTSRDWLAALTHTYISVGRKWAEEMILSPRTFEDEVTLAMQGFLEEEAIILKELSHISGATVEEVLLQVQDSLSQGLPISATQQALIDTGIFSPERALRISRTVTGAAASMGQWTSGMLSGATQKVWRTSTFDVRKAHKNRDGEVVGINDRFSVQAKSFIGPRFPGDPEISAGDRINCRCSLTFI